MITNQQIKEQRDQLYKFNNDHIEMTAKEYFLSFKNTLPSTIFFEDVDSEIKTEMIKKGWKLFFYAETFLSKEENIHSSSDPFMEDRSNTFWVKDDFYVKLILHSRGKRCNVLLGFPYDQPQPLIDEQKEFFSSFIHKSKNSKFYILIKEDHGLNIRDFSVKIPENANLELNYGSGFLGVHNQIKNKIANEDSGLFILHGNPGCGKSTYIKKLAEEISNKKFVYIPEFMIGMLNNPEMISLFIEHQNSVLVIEDAEKIIMSRESDQSSLVSIILNISDGILSDILKIPVILTYNTETENIDAALLRKGRLKYKHEFKPLKIHEVIEILKHNGVSDEDIEKFKFEGKVKDDMSIADVFFMTDDIGHKQPERKVLGFNL